LPSLEDAASVIKRRRAQAASEGSRGAIDHQEAPSNRRSDNLLKTLIGERPERPRCMGEIFIDARNGNVGFLSTRHAASRASEF
jgi:hypothetical protein